ncbi:hypothetical protein [Oerskovia flava]|uniref:hypothetical protein n=1 Tax=Oerskovia flava TaxID=2986422 RepID=UPI00223FDFAC|nr:hypothetical protein [Oerskovia sp. JB1-3-2]
MTGSVEVPGGDDLSGLPVDVSQGEEPWVRTITARAGDGDELTLTWDEVAASVHVRWSSSGRTRLEVYRECLTKVSVRDVGSCVELRVWCRDVELGGQLVAEIGERVVVTDTLLRG